MFGSVVLPPQAPVGKSSIVANGIAAIHLAAKNWTAFGRSDRIKKPLPPSVKHQERAILALAVLVAVLAVLSAYVTDRSGGVEETGLYNPTYMALHYGRLTYPVHGYFDDMIVHPPVHYEIIAWLMRAGFTYYYAEATPTLLFILLCVVLIVRSPFPASLRMGLLYGLWAAFVAFRKLGVENFGMRPEGHLSAAWLAGLLLLETARLRKWDRKALFAGAFLATYAAGLQYYAWPSLVSLGLYGLWMLVKLGRRAAAKPLLAAAAGALLFGIPYLALFVIPEYHAIAALVRSTQSTAAAPTPFQAHLMAYRDWHSLHIVPGWLGLPIRFGVPMILVSTPLLLAVRATGLAVSSLPLQLFLLLVSWHKHEYYFSHEVLFFAASVVAATVALGERLVSRQPYQLPKAMLWVLVVASLGVSLWQRTALPAIAVFSRPTVQEAEFARAAGREMLGSDARVGSRIGAWYASGGTHWHNLDPDLMWHALPPSFDIRDYAAQFDAIAEYRHMSYATLNRQQATLSSWYAGGTLQLSGFFFAESNPELSYLLLRPRPPRQLIGYGMKNRQLYRFTEDSGGEYTLSSSLCWLRAAVDVSDPARFYPELIWPELASNRMMSLALFLPGGRPAPSCCLITALVPSGNASASALPSGCRVLQQFRGSVRPVDEMALLAKFRREDQPIRFYEDLIYMPGVAPRIGLPPPPDAVQLTSIDLKKIVLVDRNAAIYRQDSLKVVTGRGMGAFAASIPISIKLPRAIPCWVHLKVRVLAGRVGLGVFSRSARDFLTDPPVVSRGAHAVDVYIPLQSLEGADDLIVRSAEESAFSQIILEEADLWVRRQNHQNISPAFRPDPR